MFVTMVQPLIVVPVGESVLFSVLGAQSRTVTLVLENLDAANTMTYKIEKSADNTTWDDFVATSTLGPDVFSAPIDLLGFPFFRMKASGNLNIAAHISGNHVWNSKFAVLNT